MWEIPPGPLQTVLTLGLLACPAFAREFHVAPEGPLKTISAAAALAQPGDTVTVHAGTYRERVTPPRGGESDSRRIVYRAAPGETVVIKGSEVVRGWNQFAPGVWKVRLPDSFFGSYKPYKDLIEGDWFNAKGRPHHTGEVYLDGKALSESHLLERVLNEPSTWFCETGDRYTYIYANFGNSDPNRQLAEIHVRDAVFYPDQPGRNYITVRGFRLAHAATQWAAPTAEQIGLIGTHWSKGWIIEDNVISDSKCSCVTLGKDRATGHNVWNKDPRKDGATHYNETILRALDAGWSRETVGSHVVRNNIIFNCEQAGIAGSMGAIFSRITRNRIYNIWARRQFAGAEMAGIKLHGAIDVLIANNRIHAAGRGLWMDWMAQGTRITGNLLYGNTTDDLFVEVNHGPFLVDNNVFLSPTSLLDVSEGGAYVHNLMAGKLVSRPEPKRSTPYHKAHSTALAGLDSTSGGDNRFYNNIFSALESLAPSPWAGFGLWVYDQRPFPLFTGGNAYLAGARPYFSERGPLKLPESQLNPAILEDGDSVVLRLALSPDLRKASTQRVTTELLGKARVSRLPYENMDGAPVVIGSDYFGRQRSAATPSPGPFENPGSGDVKLKVW